MYSLHVILTKFEDLHNETFINKHEFESRLNIGLHLLLSRLLSAYEGFRGIIESQQTYVSHHSLTLLCQQIGAISMCNKFLLNEILLQQWYWIDPHFLSRIPDIRLYYFDKSPLCFKLLKNVQNSFIWSMAAFHAFYLLRIKSS